GELAVFQSDMDRIEAILSDEKTMKARLAQLGLNIDETKPVIKAVFERDDVRESFDDEWRKRGDFWKDFTQEGKRGVVWGDAAISGTFSQKLLTALDVDSEEGV